MSLPSTPSVTSLLFIAYFFLLITALVYRSRIVSGPWFFLLRSFFPNWRFFHRVGAVPVLFVRRVASVAGHDAAGAAASVAVLA